MDSTTTTARGTITGSCRPEIASQRAIERLSKTREILKEKARIEMARRAKEAKLKHKRPTKPNSVIIYRRVKKKKRKENL